MDEEHDDELPTESSEEKPIIPVADWFKDQREVWLDLDGVRYRLRLTRRNKLILQK